MASNNSTCFDKCQPTIRDQDVGKAEIQFRKKFVDHILKPLKNVNFMYQFFYFLFFLNFITPLGFNIKS